MAGRRPAQEPAKKLPTWTQEDPLVCEGGPFAGQWFTLPEWEHRLRAAQRMKDLLSGFTHVTWSRRAGKTTARKNYEILKYVPANRQELHPELPVQGDVWQYREEVELP